MKSIYSFLAFLLTVSAAVAQSPTPGKSYVMQSLVKAAGHKTTASLNGLPVDSINRTIQYLDGLGRLVEAVQWQGSPGKKDLVQLSAYDSYGREATKYLPYAEQSSADGSFKTAAATNQANFYGTGWDNNIPKTPQPFSTSVFDHSPLNQVVEQGAEGAAWQPYSAAITGSGHTVKMTRTANAAIDTARLWVVTPTGAQSTATYTDGTLYKTITKDENWVPGKAGTTEEFKDKQGRVVLKKVWKDETTSLKTYYVYDDYGNLRYVVPPAAELTSFTESGDVFEYFIYGYHYDERNRLVEKKVPGKGWEALVYNKLGQVVVSQDANQRTGNKWSFTKYDASGRVILTGITSSTATRADWQSSIDAQVAPNLWEERDNGNTSGSGTGYTSRSLPLHSDADVYYSINYYDDYAFYGNSSSYAAAGATSNKTRGLATGSSVNVLGSTTRLLSVTYYDEDGRMIETVAANLPGGTDRVRNTYNFAGELTAATRTHTLSSETTTIINTFSYDHAGRKISTTSKINAGPVVTLSKLAYNEVGQLKQKYLHSTDGGSTFLQNTKFAYNIRGWLKESNAAEFKMKLGYDTTANPQYNGNISTQLWGSSYGNKFLYTYDPLNRLTNGTSTGIAMAEVLTYDKMGNIKTLDRDAAGVSTYNYTGNRLNSISGSSITMAGSYAYDANGNATTDGRNGVTLSYNVLNLPATVTKTGLSMAYTYDATGRKLKKVSSTGGTTDYVNGIQYQAGSIDFIQTEEGRALNNAGTYTYQYNLTDHLGNVRYSFDIYAGAVRRLQSDDYYAFGLRKSVSPVSLDNKYLYNGKELQDELGQYDYRARFYDPIIGRWNVIDPLVEKSRRWSPYTYGKNSPIVFVDPDGMFDVKINGSEADKAKDELQKSVQGQLNLVRDEKTGNISYTQVDGATLNDNAMQLKNAIDDHSVVVNVNASNNTKDIVGGGFAGNTVTKGANGQNMVVANQEINPNVLGAADSYYGKPGQNTLHEVTEAYQGGRLAQASGVSTPSGKSAIYDKAHGDLSVKQAGPIISKVTDASGNFLSSPYKNASWVIWLVSDGVKQPLVIQQLPVPKQ